MNKGAEVIRKKGMQTTEVLHRVEEMLQTFKFGTITLVVQDGEVIQIDKTEKFRINRQG